MTATAHKRGSPEKSEEDRALDGTRDRKKYARKKEGPKGVIKNRPEYRTKSECGNVAPWLRNAADAMAFSNGCWYDEAQAEFVRWWFREYLRHVVGALAEKPFELLDWQFNDIIGPMFGWVRPNGTRRFRTSYIEIPKKAGKSTLASGVGLFLMCGDDYPGAEIYSAATSRDQAGIVHDTAINMVDASPVLKSNLEINRTTGNILYRAKRSFYRKMAARPKGSEGLKGHGVICDELHAWQGTELWDALEFAGAADPCPLRFVITTAGEAQEGVCWDEHAYALDVLNGDVEDMRHFAHVLALDEKTEDWRDPAVQKRLNPMLGVTMDPEEFAQDMKRAEAIPSKLNTLLRYRFNVWCSSTNVWLDRNKWDDLGDSELEMTGTKAWVGLDLSQNEDLSAVSVVMFDDDQYKLFSHFWLPEDAIENHKLKATLRHWADGGHLTIQPGNQIEFAPIEDWIIGLCKELPVQEIAYDKFYATATAQRIHVQTGVEVVAFPQTLSYFSKPVLDFERLVKMGRITHDANPALSWQIGHCTVYEDPTGNRKPVKPKRGDYRKVDGVITSVMAIGRAFAGEDKVDWSTYYETNEVMSG